MAHNCLSPPHSPPPSRLSAKPLIETNFQYNRTDEQHDGCDEKRRCFHFSFSYFCNYFPAPTTLWLPLLDAPKSVTFYERSFVLPPLPVYQFYLLLSCCRFFTSLHFRCCFCNFMFLTNLSLSGLLFTLGSFLLFPFFPVQQNDCV